MPRILCLLFISILFSCQENVKEADKLKIEVPNKSSHKLSYLIDTTMTVKLDHKAALGSIEKIVYSNGIFFVGDFNNAKSITLFDQDGFLIRAINCKEKIVDFAVDENNSELYILSGIYILAYSTESHDDALYKLRIPFYATGITILKNNQFCFNLHKAQSYDVFNSEFIVTNQDFEIVSNYLPYSESCVTGFYSVDNPFGNDKLSTSVLRKFDASVYAIEDDKLVKKIAFDFGDNNAPFPLVSHCHQEYLSLMEEHDIDHKVLGVDNYYKYSQSVYATYVFNNYVHALHYDLEQDRAYSYSLGDVENDLFEGDFYFIPKAKYSENEFVFINEPLYNDIGVPQNPMLVIGSFKSIL